MDEQTSPRTTVRIGSASAFNLAAQIIALACSFVMSVIIARNLGPVGKGHLTVVQQVPATLFVLLNFGIAAGNVYFVGSGRQRAGNAAGNSLAAAASLGLIGLPIVWFFTMGPLQLVEGITPVQMWLAVLALPITLAASYLSGIATGLGRLRSLAIMQSVGPIAGLTLVLALTISNNIAITAVLAISVATAALTVWLVWRVIRPSLGRLRLSWSDLRASAKYSFKAYLGGLAGYLNYRVDLLLLGSMAGAAAVGVYSIGVTVAELMWYVPNALSGALLAKAVGDADGSAEYTARTSRISTLIMVTSLVAGVVLMRPFIIILYGEQFLGAYYAFLLLAPGVLALGIAKIHTAYLGAHGRLYPAISVSAAALNILGNLVLIPRYGYLGSAVASTVSYTLSAAIHTYLFLKHSHLSLRSVLLPQAADLTDLVTVGRGYLSAAAQKVRARSRR